MEIYDGIENFKKVHYPVVTSGTFDGVHLGHQKILQKIKEDAKRNNGQTIILTFWPHPKFVLHPEDQSLKLLTTFEEKAELLDRLGIDHLIKIPFTKSFSQTSSDAFIKEILERKLGTKELVIGHDHRFGKNREGSFEYLKANSSKYGFKVIEIPRQDIDHIAISSTKIRSAISNHKIHMAHKLLGRPYSLAGQVVKGNRLGQTIGFPTANIEINQKYKLVPAEGAYAVKITWKEQRYDGMLNIGFRPTLGGSAKTIEVHIFNFNQIIYDEQLKVDFIKLIRKETKFADLEALQSQLKKDLKTAKRILSDPLT
ncbi:MAG: bifunctional riboflavin kinase/FAD synthetase [Cyclobacteriaceae bacterium]